MSLLARIFKKPPERWTGPTQQPAAEPPRSLNPLAGNFPQWADPVVTELDREAYTHIRRTEATAQPVQHLGMMMAGRKVQVVCENAEFANIVQSRCIDRMRGVGDAIQYMAWAVVEGVRFCHINGEYDDSDWVVPTLINGGRRKDKAGGPMLWDGHDSIVSKRLDRGAALVGYDETEPASYPRHEWMVWRPGGGDNPEGDTDLGYRLYRLARLYQDSTKSLMVYLERYGIPVTVVKAQLEGLGPDDAAQVLTDAARKAAQMRRGNTVGLDAAQTMDFINPDGTAWQLLIEGLRHIGAEAHKAVLMNSTTSDPQAVGPDQRGSSDVHKSVEEAVVEQYCNSFSDTALRDLQRYIEVVNAERLREATREALGNDVLMRIPPWRLRLMPSVAERDVDQTRILDLYNAGVAVKPADLYGAFGAETPEGVEDVLKKEQQNPFGAFGGLGGERAALSASLAPRELADEALEQPGQPIETAAPAPAMEPVKAPAPAPERMEERAPIEELYDSMADEYREVINKAFFAIAEQLERGKPNPKLPEAVLMMNAKANLLAELAGRAEAQAEIEAHHGKPDAYMALAERAAERVSLSRWITIGGGEDEDGKRTGGRRVQISDDGVIEKGLSREAQGKTLSEAFSDPEATFGRKSSGGQASEPEQKAPKQRTVDDVAGEIAEATDRMKELRSEIRSAASEMRYRERLVQKRGGESTDAYSDGRYPNAEAGSNEDFYNQAADESDRLENELLDLEDKRNSLKAEQRKLKRAGGGSGGGKASRSKPEASTQAAKAKPEAKAISAEERDFLEKRRERLLEDFDLSAPPEVSKRAVDEINEIDRRLAGLAPEAPTQAASAPDLSGKLLQATDRAVRDTFKAGNPQAAFDGLVKQARDAETLEDKMRAAVAAEALLSAARQQRDVPFEQRSAAIKRGEAIPPSVEDADDSIRSLKAEVAELAQKAKKADIKAALDSIGEGLSIRPGATKADLVKRVRSASDRIVEASGTYIELSADDSERVSLAKVWRTIGAKNGRGGTPVQIDEDTGEIVKGPDQLKGKDADSPEPGASRAGGSDESEAYDYFQDLENELAGDVENGMDVSERLEAIGNDARDMVPGLPDAEARAFARDLGIDAQDLGRDELEDELLAAMDERLRDAAGISESRSTFSRALDAVNSAGFDLATGAIDLAGKALGGAAKLAWRAISSDGVWAVVTDTPLIATPFRLAEIGRRIVMRLFATPGTYEESLPKWFGLVPEDEDRGPIFNASTAERVRLAETISDAQDAYRMAEASLIEASIPREWARLIAPIAVLELGRTQDALTADSLRDLTASVILAADGEMPDDPAGFVREFIADRPDGSGELADPVAEARERTKLARWITIGGGEDEDGNKRGGRRVQIGDDGRILKGLSKNAEGKTLKEAFSDTEATFGRKGGGESSSSNDKPRRSPYADMSEQELYKQAREHDRLFNEGGDGPNPYQDELQRRVGGATIEQSRNLARQVGRSIPATGTSEGAGEAILEALEDRGLGAAEIAYARAAFNEFGAQGKVDEGFKRFEEITGVELPKYGKLAALKALAAAAQEKGYDLPPYQPGQPLPEKPLSLYKNVVGGVGYDNLDDATKAARESGQDYYTRRRDGKYLKNMREIVDRPGE